jgi:hypothetical protein
MMAGPFFPLPPPPPPAGDSVLSSKRFVSNVISPPVKDKTEALSKTMEPNPSTCPVISTRDESMMRSTLPSTRTVCLDFNIAREPDKISSFANALVSWL